MKMALDTQSHDDHHGHTGYIRVAPWVGYPGCVHLPACNGGGVVIGVAGKQSGVRCLL